MTASTPRPHRPRSPSKRVTASASASTPAERGSAPRLPVHVPARRAAPDPAAATTHNLRASWASLVREARFTAAVAARRATGFVREHPAEAAGMATAGLTVVTGLLGRRRVGALTKTAALTGVLAQAAGWAQRLGAAAQRAASPPAAGRRFWQRWR